MESDQFYCDKTKENSVVKSQSISSDIRWEFSH